MINLDPNPEKMYINNYTYIFTVSVMHAYSLLYKCFF